ncbi:hypothetical protein AGMMS49928_03250 [Spirochaetia bacterium]|nr:hypothetical protein AGMMS49928_03250 [Spirochaetia bacterium]
MKKAGEIVSSIINGYFGGQFREKAKTYGEFFSSWAAILKENGIPDAADHSRIAELEKKTVRVEADHPGWVQIIQTKEKEILAALQRGFSDFDIRGISVRYVSGFTRAIHPPRSAR